MVTNAERGRQVRRRLLAAAVDLVAELGWSAVSTRALAERAGVVPSVVHYHFPSMPVLLREAAVVAMRALLDELGDLLDQAETHEDALDLILQGVDRYTGLDATSVLLIETYLAATRDDALREAIGGEVRVFRERLARWFAEHHVAAPEETAVVLTAAIDGVVLYRALDPALGELAVAPVLRRLLVPAAGRPQPTTRDKGQHSQRRP